MQHTDLSPEESNQKTIEAVSAARPILFGKFNVDGDKSWSAPYMSVRQLIFRPGGRLIFDESVTRANRNIFVFAEEIISEDQENPGTVTWVDVAPSIPPAAGSGVAGVNQGGAENVGGGMGGTGPEGLQGELGASAPSLTIVVKNIVGGLKLGLRGEDGGSGGMGGTGGAGGQGGRGTNASQSMFDCKRGAGNGAQGGSGGAGGSGGQGGRGGNGGTFTLITESDNVAMITRLLAVDLTPGIGGGGGEGGLGGAGGPGGPGGADARPYCQGAGNDGPAGPAGGHGGAGANGQSGVPGQYYVGGLSVADLESVLK